MRPAARVAAAIIVAATVALSAQSHRVHAIGCISRSGSSYVITDRRGDPPLVYRLDGDATELDFQVGHTVEVSGPLSADGAITIEQIVWIRNSC